MERAYASLSHQDHTREEEGTETLRSNWRPLYGPYSAKERVGLGHKTGERSLGCSETRKTLSRLSPKGDWRTEKGEVMSWRTVDALREKGLLN